MPSSVPGILIIRLGRSTRSQYSRACSIVRSVSKARSGSTSKRHEAVVRRRSRRRRRAARRRRPGCRGSRAPGRSRGRPGPRARARRAARRSRRSRGSPALKIVGLEVTPRSESSSTSRCSSPVLIRAALDLVQPDARAGGGEGGEALVDLLRWPWVSALLRGLSLQGEGLRVPAPARRAAPLRGRRPAGRSGPARCGSACRRPGG